MSTWVDCSSGFIEADVIRWHESIWDRRGSRTAKPLRIGVRTVVAQVVREDLAEGWVWLEVRSYEITERYTQKDTGHLKVGEQIKRQRSTIARSKPERLLWSDEDNRTRLAAERRPPRSAPPKRRRTKPREKS